MNDELNADTTGIGVYASAAANAPVVASDPLQGPRWPTTSVTWSLATANYSGQPSGTQFSSFITDGTQALVRKAVALWSAVSGLVLTEVKDSVTANIRIGYERLNTPSSGTVGLTTYNSTTLTMQSAMVGLEDPAELGTSATPDGDLAFNNGSSRMFQVIVHELGHALGLAHNGADPQSVMFPTATSVNRSIDLNDATGIETLYGGTSSRLSAMSVSKTGNTRFDVAQLGSVNPFSGLSVTDGAGLYERVQVTLSGGGSLRDPTAGTDAAFSGGVFTESGTNLTTANYAETILRRLVFTAPAGTGEADFQVQVTNSLQVATTFVGAISVNYAPVTTPPSITGLTDRSGNDLSAIQVLTGVAISDPNSVQTQVVTVSLSNPQNGLLSNLSGGSYSAATGVYTVTGTAAVVNAALGALVFTPTAHQQPAGALVTTTLTVTDVNAAGASVSGTEKVVVTETAAAVPVFTIGATAADKPEGNSGTTPYTFTIARFGNTTGSQTVGWAVTGSGAYPADAADFGGTLPSGTVSFAPGETSKAVIVNVAGDLTAEPDETFTVTISVPSGGYASVPTAVGTIRNDDVAPAAGPVFDISPAAADKPEGNSGMTTLTFLVRRSGDTTGVQTVNYSVAGSGTYPADANDFGGTLPSGTLTFAAGESAKTIAVNVSGDTVQEPDETFSVTLSSPSSGKIGTASALGTIRNDDETAYTGVVDGTTGKSSLVTLVPVAAGGPSYLKWQYIYAGSDDMAVSTETENVFLHSGGGNDALQVSKGQNVLDGGVGSNFLTGGSGTDTFFTDARAPGVVWNTIRNFHAGDAATLWGFTPGVSSYRWEDASAGAAGSEGATLRANIVGGSGRSGDGIDASITFTGLSVAQARNLQVATGTQTAGTYLFLYNPGV